MKEQDINVLLETLRQTFIIIMRQIDLDKSELVKRSRFIWQNESIIIQMNDYAEYVDKGRRVGSMPPVQDIASWIRKEAISIPSGLSVEDFAWAVSKSIEKKGIKPKPFLERLNVEVNDLTLKYINNKIVEDLRKVFDKK